jgi:hypothetical protein
MDKYGFWTPYDAGCAIGPKLSTIILDGEWFGLVQDQISLWRSKVSCRKLFLRMRTYQFGNLAKEFIYNCAETWEHLRVKYHVVEWHKYMWFSLAIPRHSFIL